MGRDLRTWAALAAAWSAKRRHEETGAVVDLGDIVTSPEAALAASLVAAVTILGLPGDGMADAEAHGKGSGAVVAGATGTARNVPAAPPGGGGPGGGPGLPSRLPSGGGGEVGVRPVGGGAGGGEGHWTQASGGLGGLSDGQRQDAGAAYGEWSASNPEAAARHGLDGYVSYAQAREAQRGGQG